MQTAEHAHPPLRLPPEAASARPAPTSGDRRQRRVQGMALGALALYLAAIAAVVGLRVEHLVLAAVYLALTLAGGRALRFLLLFAPVVLTGASYELFRLVEPLRGQVHVAELYGAEARLFGIGAGSEIPAAWLLRHTHPAADLVAGLAYIVYLYVPIGLAVALYFRDQQRMLAVGWALLLTNMLGLLIYLAYPAAPPWYVLEHGLGPAQLQVAPSAAGAARFDALVGGSYFAHFYARSANVFGAMPSLHVAYPLSSLLAVAGMGKRWTVPLAIFTLVVAWAAVYLQHHYLLDVLGGVACAVGGWLLARWLLARWRYAQEGRLARAVA